MFELWALSDALPDTVRVRAADNDCEAVTEPENDLREGGSVFVGVADGDGVSDSSADGDKLLRLEIDGIIVEVDDDETVLDSVAVVVIEETDERDIDGVSVRIGDFVDPRVSVADCVDEAELEPLAKAERVKDPVADCDAVGDAELDNDSDGVLEAVTDIVEVKMTELVAIPD